MTGAAGQVGSELARTCWPKGAELILADRSVLDICDRDAVGRFVAGESVDVIVNAAAYTAVDAAEDDPAGAFAVNHLAVANLALAATASDATLIHLSTDYVFDGGKEGWYGEAEVPNPTGVYGASKLAGEREVLKLERGIVLRTAWVYGALRPNFVTTMRRLAAERDELGVVADQIGCPTAAMEIAKAITQIVSAGATHAGLFHVAAPDEASWWDLAVEAIALMEPPRSPLINRLTTEQFPTKAARPANSRLDSTHLAEAYGIQLPPWRESLQQVSVELNRAS